MPDASPRRPVVAVIPAAGRATRIAPLPCSKELLPVGVHHEPDARRGRPKAISHYLLDKLRAAGATRVFFVVRSGKFDIAEYYGDGAALGLSIAYLMMGEPWGPPFSVSQAAPFIDGTTVLFGFPDILIRPEDGFTRALARLEATGADLVLGLFRGRLEDGLDIVEADTQGRVTRLTPKEDKPARREGDTGYMLAAWGPGFTRFLVAETQRLSAIARSGARGPNPDWPMGSVFAAAVREGLHVDSVFMHDAHFQDIGTPAGLAAALDFPGVWSGREPAP